MQKDPELKAWPRRYCDELLCPSLNGLSNFGDSGVVILVAIAVKYTKGAIIVTKASFRERNDAQGVRAVGGHDLNIRATESVV